MSSKGHQKVTKRSPKGHWKANKRSLQGHWKVSERSPKGHQRSPKGHQKVTERSLKGHQKVTKRQRNVYPSAFRSDWYALYPCRSLLPAVKAGDHSRPVGVSSLGHPRKGGLYRSAMVSLLSVVVIVRVRRSVASRMIDDWLMIDDCLIDDGWWMINDWWWMIDDRSWMADDGWWMMDDGWCMMDDGSWSDHILCCHDRW